MPTITPFLWFDSQAQEAAWFYASVFKDAKVGGISTYDKTVAEVAERPAGSVMTVDFELAGQKFMGLNGGPVFKFTEAVSFMVTVEDQAELDYFWSALTADGGEESQCGWLKDKFGLSWQIVPKQLGEYIGGSDPEASERAMKAMLGMKKLDIATLERAYNGQ